MKLNPIPFIVAGFILLMFSFSFTERDITPIEIQTGKIINCFSVICFAFSWSISLGKKDQ
jgi:hypothetical protein